MNHCVASLLVAAAVLALSSPAHAVRPDECEQQRALYPQSWNDISKETPLFECRSHYSYPLLITVGTPDDKGRSLMSLVPAKSNADLTPAADAKHPIRRIWLDADQARRLREGKYFATVVRSEESCWIRGDLGGDPIFFMDNANPPTEGEPGESAFYNKAPRISVFEANAYSCEPVK